MLAAHNLPVPGQKTGVRHEGAGSPPGSGKWLRIVTGWRKKVVDIPCQKLIIYLREDAGVRGSARQQIGAQRSA